MTDHEELPEEYVKRLREAVEAVAAGEADWAAFHSRLNAAVAARLADLRRRVPGSYRAATAIGATWWDYAARAGLAALPLGLVAALLLFTYLRSSEGNATDARASPCPAARQRVIPTPRAPRSSPCSRASRLRRRSSAH